MSTDGRGAASLGRFEAHLRETIERASAERDARIDDRRRFLAAWNQSRETLRGLFADAASAFSRVGVAAEVSRCNGTRLRLKTDRATVAVVESGGVITWTVTGVDGAQLDYPEELTPEPLNLEWREYRLRDFCARYFELSLAEVGGSRP